MKVCPNCGKQYPDEANFCPVDAGRLEAGNDTTSPQMLVPAEPEPEPAPVMAEPGERVVGERFVLAEPIGGGLTGEVFRASDRRTGETVAVKLVDATVFPSNLDAQRTEREMRQLQRLRSDGVAKVIASGKDGDTTWIATELIAGAQSLHDLVFDSGPMDPVRASQIIVKVGQTLADAAKVGAIHRDLAPKNILIGPGDTVKLINFGVPVPASKKVQGVPEFVSPEMVEGKPVDQRANIYSLGAVFYYMIAGRPPYMGEPEEVYEQHISADPMPPSEHVEDVPEVVDYVILKAMARAASKRFMTLRQFLASVEPVAQGKLDAEIYIDSNRPARGKGKEKDKRKLSSTMLGGYGTAESAAGSSPAMPQQPGQPAGHVAPSQQPQEAGSGFQATLKMGAMPAAQLLAATAKKPAATAGLASGTAQAGQGHVEEAREDMVPGPEAPQRPHQRPGSVPFPTLSAAGKQRAAYDEHSKTEKMESPIPEQRTIPRGAAANFAPPLEERKASEPRPGIAVSNLAPEAEYEDDYQDDGPMDNKSSKPRKNDKFRETLWFKKGEIDSATAANPAAGTDSEASADKADQLPIEDRYQDDGTLTPGDREKFSLKTGGTETVPVYREPAPGPSVSQQVSENELIGEMKGGRGKLIAGIVIGVILVIALIMFAMSGGSKEPAEGEGAAKPAVPAPGAPAPSSPAPSAPAPSSPAPAGQ